MDFVSAKKDIQTVIERINSSKPYIDNDDLKIKIDLILKVLQYMERNSEGWDTHCVFNVHSYGETFLSQLSSFDVEDTKSVEFVLVFCYRFVCEYDFSIGYESQLNADLLENKRWVLNNIKKFNTMAQEQIIQATYEMPASILKYYIHQKEINDISDFNLKLEQARTVRDNLNSEIQGHIDTVNDLKQSLDKYETGFNFVGLSKGFSEIHNKKTKEQKHLLFSLISMSILILAPLFYELMNITVFSDSNTNYDLDSFIKYAPILPFEIILLYYFRILLTNFNSVKTQILQLELRMTLCKFIQSYANYSSEINKKNPNSLEKFENLIFSGILSESERIPSTFDGLEQISNLIKSAK